MRKPRDRISRIEVIGYFDIERFELREPSEQAILRAIVEVPGWLVQRLHECSLHEQYATRPQNAPYFGGHTQRIVKVLESVESHNRRECPVDEGEPVSVGDNVGVAEDPGLD